MKPEISEFSYGYAITEELARGRFGLTAAPVFPSLYAEGQTGGGYDVMLKCGAVPIYLQFKLSHCMVRPTAMETHTTNLTCPFFRMHLRPASRSKQHEELLKRDRAGDLVAYVAPCFHEEHEFNNAYMSQAVCSESIWIRPKAIGNMPTNDRHHIAFDLSRTAYLCSTPKLLRGQHSQADFFNRIDRALAETESGVDSSSLLSAQLASLELASPISVRAQVRDAFKLSPDFDESAEKTLLMLSVCARLVLDAQLFLVTRSEFLD